MSKKISTKENLLPPLWVTVLVVFAGLIWVATELKDLLTLLVIAFAISYLIEPLLETLEKYKISRPIGFFVLLGFAIAVIALSVTTIVPVLSREFSQLISNFPEYLETARVYLEPYYIKVTEKLQMEDLSSHTESFGQVVKDYVPTIFEKAKSTVLQGYSITLGIINLALLPFIIFYTSMSFPSYLQLTLDYFPDKYHDKLSKILTEINRDVSAFVRGQIIVSFVLFLLYAIGLGAVGVELWFLLAVIAGFGNLVPYLGSIIGVILASIMTLITFGDFTHLFYVWGVFALVQFLEGTFITPKIIGRNVGISPLTVILSILAGGQLFGLLGVFLAVPGAAIARVLGKHFHAWLVAKA